MIRRSRESRSIWLSALAALTPLFAATGCIIVSDFDPVGTAASVSGAWLIDDAAPNEASCDAMGADRVRIAFLDAGRAVTHSGLVFECQRGAFRTTDGTNAVVAAGDWVIRYEVIDGGGALIASSSEQTAMIRADSGPLPDGGTATTPNISLVSYTFYSAIVTARFTVGGERATLDLCTAEGISDVGILIDGVEQPDSRTACQRGLVGARLAPGRTHSVELATFDSGGVMLARSPLEMFTVSPGDVCEMGGTCRARCDNDSECNAGESCSDDRCGTDAPSPSLVLP